MRLFIAVNISDEVKEKLSGIQRDLKRVPADVRWVEPEWFHLTLKFIGEVAEQNLEALVGSLSRAVAGAGPFNIVLAGVGAFPDLRAPRVVWAGVSAGGDELRRLAGSIEDECFALGYPREQRPFEGHLTLGRVRSRRNCGALGKRIAGLGGVPIGSLAVSRVDVMQSVLDPGGARYTCLRSISISSSTATSFSSP